MIFLMPMKKVNGGLRITERKRLTPKPDGFVSAQPYDRRPLLTCKEDFSSLGNYQTKHIIRGGVIIYEWNY